MEETLLLNLESKIADILFRKNNARIQAACKSADIVTVGDLVRLTNLQVSALNTIGKGTLGTITDFLSRYRLRLGMSESEIHAYQVQYIEQDQEQKRLSMPPGASVWEEKILSLSQQIFKDLYVKSGLKQRTDYLAKFAICAAEVFFDEYRQRILRNMNNSR